MADPKYMNIEEFRNEGYLQELNRRFLHPLGLALEVRPSEDGEWTLGGIWDYRDDPEGIRFAVGDDEASLPYVERAQRISEVWTEREYTRVPALGYMIQPVGEVNEV